MNNAPFVSRELIEDFAAEALGSLQALPDQLAAWRLDASTAEPLHALFRAIHSIKGNAGFLGLTAIKSFAHSLENTLDDLRQRKRPLTAELEQALVESFELLAVLVAAVLENRQENERFCRVGAILERLAALATAEVQPVPPAAAMDPLLTARARGEDRLPRLVRVKQQRLDELFEQATNLLATGELLTELHLLLDEAAGRHDPQRLDGLIVELRALDQGLAAQFDALRQTLAGLRLAPLGTLLEKFPRLARSLAEQLGKRVEVNLAGEEIEIDRRLIADLDAALAHLIRNALVHGLETPPQRRRRGVSETGNLWLRAEQTLSHVRIYVRDDGRGIDACAMREKAVECGLLALAQAHALSDAEAIGLIFRPGFSTADEVTEISGRGVGLDVVRTVVQSHHGTVLVESQGGVGTTFCLEFPLRDAAPPTGRDFAPRLSRTPVAPI